MKVNIILVDECGDEVIAETLSSEQVAILRNYLDDFVQVLINKIQDNYPECRGVYREDVKSPGELAAEKWEEIYDEEYAWALAHEDEIDTDPEEYAHDMADSYFQDNWFF